MELVVVLIILALASALLIRHGLRFLRRDESPCCGCSTCTLPEEVRQQCGMMQELHPSQPVSETSSVHLQGDKS